MAVGLQQGPNEERLPAPYVFLLSQQGWRHQVFYISSGNDSRVCHIWNSRVLWDVVWVAMLCFPPTALGEIWPAFPPVSIQPTLPSCLQWVWNCDWFRCRLVGQHLQFLTGHCTVVPSIIPYEYNLGYLRSGRCGAVSSSTAPSPWSYIHVSFRLSCESHFRTSRIRLL